MSVVCCQVEVSATDWSFVQRSPTECNVSKKCVIVKLRKMRRPRPPKGLSSHWKKGKSVPAAQQKTESQFSRAAKSLPDISKHCIFFILYIIIHEFKNLKNMALVSLPPQKFVRLHDIGVSISRKMKNTGLGVTSSSMTFIRSLMGIGHLIKMVVEGHLQYGNCISMLSSLGKLEGNSTEALMIFRNTQPREWEKAGVCSVVRHYIHM